MVGTDGQATTIHRSFTATKPLRCDITQPQSRILTPLDVTISIRRCLFSTDHPIFPLASRFTLVVNFNRSLSLDGSIFPAEGIRSPNFPIRPPRTSHSTSSVYTDLCDILPICLLKHFLIVFFTPLPLCYLVLLDLVFGVGY